MLNADAQHESADVCTYHRLNGLLSRTEVTVFGHRLIDIALLILVQAGPKESRRHINLNEDTPSNTSYRSNTASTDEFGRNA